MSKIISVNAGSSSLKFQLFEMDDETVITSGVIERIGLEDSIFTIKYNGEKDVTTLPIENHKVAVQLLLDTLIKKEIVKDLDEIKVLDIVLSKVVLILINQSLLMKMLFLKLMN